MGMRDRRSAIGGGGSGTGGRTVWSYQVVLIAVTVVLVLQNTKHAVLPPQQTPLVWAAELAVMAGLDLRSGWGRDNDWGEEQRRLGTLANNYYEPRREALVNGGAVAGGVLGGLWWGIATWAVVLFGMRRGVAGHGLFDFEVAAVMGALTGGVIGAVGGLFVGHVWQTRHRRNRYTKQTNHA